MASRRFRQQPEALPDYRGDGFAPHRIYPLSRLAHTGEGDVLVAITSDEAAPRGGIPVPRAAQLALRRVRHVSCPLISWAKWLVEHEHN